ncbi:MAG: hypothetical protein AB7F32_11640 [Victivallaceae bacterium]
MRKILRRMYLASVPRRERKKTTVEKGGVINFGTWRKWLASGGPKKYVDAIGKA